MSLVSEMRLHVPVLMAKLGYGVGAGDWVKIVDGNVAEKVGRSHAIGMVDPFWMSQFLGTQRWFLLSQTSSTR